jgi:hypothetical protein
MPVKDGQFAHIAFRALLLALAGAAIVLLGLHGATSRITQQPARFESSSPRIPLSFEPNVGQTDRVVDYVARGSGYTVFLTRREAVVALQGDRSARAVVHVRLRGASPETRPQPLDRLPGRVNYFVGNRPARWRKGIPTFGRVLYRDVYSGVDLVYYGNSRRLEYDFQISPGSSPGRIMLSYRGADRVKIGGRGQLLVGVGGRQLRQPPPRAWQDAGGTRRPVHVRYELRHGDVGFRLGAYDPSKPLVIDPVLAYSTYLGGIGEDSGNAIAVDSDGSAYVAGTTASADFPTTANAFSKTTDEAFVTKLNAAGTALTYSTYLGGSWNGDEARGIAVDASGSAYVTGTTNSPDFPTVNSFQGSLKGPSDAFVTKLAPTGAALSYSTYLGGADGVIGFGSAYDEGHAIAVDAAGSAYITGLTQSKDFPTLNPVQAAAKGDESSIVDAFVTKLQPAGNALAYSTFLGGTYRDEGSGIAVDASGRAVVAGRTYSADFPLMNARRSIAAGVEGFVTKLSAGGNAFVYSTYLGGAGDDEAHAVALDAAGNAYVTGLTESNDFPTTSGAFDTRCGTVNYCSHLNQDAFVTKVAADGSGFGYSTFLGADGQDRANGIAVDATGSATVVGTSTGDFPLVDAIQPSFGGGSFDGFAARLDPLGSSLVHSTYLGGNWDDLPLAVATGAHAGDVHITGRTTSTNFTTTPGAFDRTGGNSCDPVACDDAFVVKLESAATVPDTTPPTVSLTAPADGAIVRGTVRLAATASDDTSVRQVEFRVNGNTVGFDPYPPHESDWISTTLADGPATVTATASDPAGNSTTTAPRAVIVDNHLPDTTINSAPSAVVASRNATFLFAADEPSTFQCSLDGAQATTCSSPASYTGLSEGSHNFTVTAIDSAGNSEAAPAAWTWTVDTTAPDTRILSVPANPTNSTTATFAFDATETGATFECARDSGGFQSCSSPIAYTGLSAGPHTFQVRARDTAGNTDGSPASQSWTIDVTPPSAPLINTPVNGSITNDASITVSGDAEPASTVTVFDNGVSKGTVTANSTSGWTQTLPAESDGTHTYVARATDAAGNTSTDSGARTVTVDTVAPQTTITAQPSSPTNQTSAGFGFGADEAGSTFQCKLDNAAFAACASPKDYAGLAEGAHTFEVRAMDLAGNSDGSPAAYTWTVDLTPPDTTITAGPAPETRVTSASLSFAAEDGARFECALDGGQFAPCTSPANYTHLSEGSHVFGVRAVDRAGNPDPDPATWGWTIASPDVAPPLVSLTAPPADAAVRGDVELTAEATDDVAVAEVEFVVDGKVVATDSIAPYAARWDSHTHGDGPASVLARANDTSGNLGVSVAREVVVDNTPPETRIASGPAATTTDLRAMLAFSASESGASFECAFDGAAFSPCSSPAQGTFAVGAHTFSVRAWDAGGNLDPTPATWSWTVLPAPALPPPPPPPAPTVERATAKLVSPTLKLDARGRARVAVRCISSMRCTGMVVLRALRNRALLGRAPYSVAGRKATVIRVRLLASAARRIAEQSRIRARAQITHAKPRLVVLVARR